MPPPPDADVPDAPTPTSSLSPPPPRRQRHRLLGPLARHCTFDQDQDPTHRATTSWLLRPLHFALLRATIALYALVALAVTLALAPWPQARQLAYFTTLSWTGLCAYFVAAGVQSLAYALRGRGLLHGAGAKAVLKLLGSCVAVLPWLVVVTYWTVLRPAANSGGVGALSTFTTTTTHVLPVPLSLLELLLARTLPMPWAHLPLLLLLMALYLCLAYVMHATDGTGTYVYAFLDPRPEAGSSGGKVFAYCIGVGTGVALLFLLVRGVVALRVWVVEERWGKRGKFSVGDDGVARGAEEGDGSLNSSSGASVVERVEDVEMAKMGGVVAERERVGRGRGA